MKIVDISLDDLSKSEYIALIQSLMNYYYVMFDEDIFLKFENDVDV